MREGGDALAALDGALYVVTDRGLAAGRTHLEVAEAALRGGARALQLRDKEAGPRELVRWGVRLRKLCDRYDALFMVNDRLDVALLAGAHGLHVGQSDLPAADARHEWDGLLGVSASTVEQAVRARRAGADYIGLGPVWATPTKTDADPPCGLEGVAAARRAVDAPIVAIGGIHHGNVAQVVRAGAHAVAVISSVVAAPDVEAAARRMVELVQEARRGV